MELCLKTVSRHNLFLFLEVELPFNKGTVELFPYNLCILRWRNFNKIYCEECISSVNLARLSLKWLAMLAETSTNSHVYEQVFGNRYSFSECVVGMWTVLNKQTARNTTPGIKNKKRISKRECSTINWGLADTAK